MKKFLILHTITIFLISFCLPAVVSAKEERIADVVDVVSKAIVNIRTEELAGQASEGKSADLFKRFFAREGEEEGETQENIGSGVVLDPSGIIVTNEHLVSKAVAIRVKFTNRKEYEATVLATDPELDIALLKVEDKSDFPFLKMHKRSVRVGERTIVIGNPYDLSSSVSTGVVSAFRNNVKIYNRVYPKLIQTDAPINPGNSGGALLDAEGNLLGIVTAVYEEARGIGFAIPIEDVMSMLSDFLDHTGNRPILGIFVDKKKDENGHYLSVNRIIPGSPAERYGIRAGDRIVELDNRKIREGMKIQNVFRRANQNGKNQLKIVRGTEAFNVMIEDTSTYVPAPLDESLCGLRLSDIRGYAKMKYKLREKSGVVISKVMKGGMGERYGMKAGDVILKINNREVQDKEGFQSAMVEGLIRNYILYQIKRSDAVFFLPIKLDTLL